MPLIVGDAELPEAKLRPLAVPMPTELAAAEHNHRLRFALSQERRRRQWPDQAMQSQPGELKSNALCIHSGVKVAG